MNQQIICIEPRNIILDIIGTHIGTCKPLSWHRQM